MTNIEAMKLALDALETLDCGDSYKTHNAATALRQAISEAEQAEQEPLYISQACAERGCACHYSVEVDGEPILVYTAPQQELNLNCKSVQKRLATSWGYVKAEQEPVALIQLRQVHAVQGMDGTWNVSPYMAGMFNGLELAMAIFEDREPDYRTAPPQREWVGLTEDEVEAYEIMGGKSDAMLARALEALLKEKNT